MSFRLRSKRCIIYINKNEEPFFKYKHKNGTSSTKKKKIDYSHIVSGHIYGNNSHRTYKEFCKSLGWDISKADQFGWKKPLYASYADTNRTSNVWFIFNKNYDKNKLNLVVKNCNVINYIVDNGAFIIEINNICDKTNDANRITFIKTSDGYEFLGVYKMVENGSIRIYKRISDCYSMN